MRFPGGRVRGLEVWGLGQGDAQPLDHLYLGHGRVPQAAVVGHFGDALGQGDDQVKQTHALLQLAPKNKKSVKVFLLITRIIYW